MVCPFCSEFLDFFCVAECLWYGPIYIISGTYFRIFFRSWYSWVFRWILEPSLIFVITVFTVIPKTPVYLVTDFFLWLIFSHFLSVYFVDISADIRKLLYFAMIHSHIMYCLCIYSCANSTSLNPLRIKQKAAIRVIANADYRAHTAPLFYSIKDFAYWPTYFSQYT